jgi:hypothetical protein
MKVVPVSFGTQGNEIGHNEFVQAYESKVKLPLCKNILSFRHPEKSPKLKVL